jgi:hypothetical protein
MAMERIGVVRRFGFPRTRPAPRLGLWTALLLTFLLSGLLSACAGGAAETQAHANKAQLDQELTHARTSLGLPERLLAPVTRQEAATAKGEGGLGYNYDTAASTYHRLLTQLQSIEASAPQVLQQQAQADLQAFADLLNERRGEQFAEVPAYQARYDAATQAFTSAQTPADYAKVSTAATEATQALQALWPAYQELQTLQAVIGKLSTLGVSTQAAQDFYDSDLQVFRAAASAARYEALTSLIDAQIIQVQATAAAAQPFITQLLLDSFQARISLLKQYGDTANAAKYQAQHDDDVAQLAKAVKFSDLVALGATITQQNTAMASLLIRAKAPYDYKQLDALVHSPAVAGKMMVNKSGYDGYQSYPVAYEYLDKDNGIGDAADMLAKAHTDHQFQAADFRITSLMANLRAMLDNYDPATDEVSVLTAATRLNPVHEQPHAADLQLMQYYSVMTGKVIVVSLREQTARMYLDGKMVAFTYVTTGRPGNTSIPGFWTALNRHSPDNPNQNPLTNTPVPAGYGDVFTSPDPIPGSPGYYQPTPIHFDVAYHEFGYWLHDAYWRSTFGPETNLPHRDPAAFNGGSHGCINVPYVTSYGVNMEWIERWTPIGTPIIVY